MEKTNKKQGKGRRLKFGALATGTTVIFLAVIVIVNVVATMLLNRFPISIDITKDQIYQIDDKTIDYIKGIDSEIEITILCTKSDFVSVFDYYGATEYYQQVDQLFTRLPQYNTNIKVRYIDRDKNPDFIAKYSDENLTAESIVVQSDKRYKVLSVQQMFNMDTSNYMYTGEVTVQSCKAEESVMSALMFVTGTPVRVAAVTGHNETDVYSTSSSPLAYQLDLNNYLIEDVQLLSQSFTGDYDAIVIAAPTADYNEEEIKVLNEYLYNNGQFGKQLIYFASAQQTPLPKLEAFLKEEWGVTIEDGYLEDNENNSMAVGDTTLVRLAYTDEDYAAVVQDQDNMPMLGIQVRPLKTEFEEKGNRSTTVLLSSTDTAAVHPTNDTGWKYNKAKKGTYAAAVLATRTGTYDNRPVESNVVVTTMSLAHESMSAFTQHQQYVLNLFDTLTQRDAGITILPKSIEQASLGLNESQVQLFFVLFVIAVPALCLVAGLIIWLRRRHK